MKGVVWTGITNGFFERVEGHCEGLLWELLLPRWWG
jgi:predicted GIY-YIG superfamily endonuclease